MANSTPRGTARHLQKPRTTAARLCLVPLDCIRISPESEALLHALKPLPALVVPDETAELLAMLDPPVIVADPGREGDYLTVGDARVVQWLKDSTPGTPGIRTRVLSLIVNAPTVSRSALSAIRAYMTPLLLGRLEDRAARAARQHLKEHGIARPRGCSRRSQLSYLADR